MRIKTLTVTELSSYLKRILINDPILNNLSIKGEISNFKLHNSGHAYFSIKDSDSKLKCVMFHSDFKKLAFLPQNGMKVIVKGYISIYERNGEYQLYVSDLKEEGIGDLYLAFTKLKDKLGKEGYFDEENKKRIPFFPKKIGVITSPTGAAIRDVISVITRRNNYVDILVYPVLVQGDRASIQIAEGIRKLNSIDDIDLIILTRGGGAIEELWPFNEEIVAKSIFLSRKPVISAVGHETDFTISDFVADLRAPTPSAAGELAVPTIHEIKDTLEYMQNSLKTNLISQVRNYQSILNNYGENRMKKYLLFKIKKEQQTIDYLHTNMSRTLNKKTEILKEMLHALGDNLNSLSPLSTISRGYAILQNEKRDTTITDIEEVKLGDKVNVLLKNGLLKCNVENIEKGEGLFGR
jgi:exodeoxyribonuclease VII large subunit